jgi:hypothetical protein
MFGRGRQVISTSVSPIKFSHGLGEVNPLYSYAVDAVNQQL